MAVAKLASGDETEARDLGYADAFTLDATIIATALAQLADEGRIDLEVLSEAAAYAGDLPV